VERKKLSRDEIETCLAGLKDWTISNEKLSRKFEFINFADALAFVNKVGEIAQRLDHHPDILFGWGYAEFFITTHDAGGLTHNDFDLAAAIENL
jgi:4a-hydroxytetrahydrobiopterin dehydratase